MVFALWPEQIGAELPYGPSERLDCTHIDFDFVMRLLYHLIGIFHLLTQNSTENHLYVHPEGIVPIIIAV